MAEGGSQVGQLDEYGQGDVRFHRTGLCPEVPVGGRPRLWLAHLRQGGVPGFVDYHFLLLGLLPVGLDPAAARRR